MDTRKGLLWAGLGALTVSTLLAVGIFLFGSFSETQIRLIGTTCTIGIFSLTAFAAVGSQAERSGIFAAVGLVSSVLASLFTQVLIWNTDSFEDKWIVKTTCILAVLAFALAHSAVLYRVMPERGKNPLTSVVAATLTCIGLTSLMIIQLIITDSPPDSELYYRLLAVFAVLSVAGSIAAPITKKLTATNI